MPTYTSILATTPTYTEITTPESRTYDDANVGFDDSEVFYDSGNPNQYTSVAAVSPTYTSVAAAI